MIYVVVQLKKCKDVNIIPPPHIVKCTRINLYLEDHEDEIDRGQLVLKLKSDKYGKGYDWFECINGHFVQTHHLHEVTVNAIKNPIYPYHEYEWTIYNTLDELLEEHFVDVL